MASDGEPRLGGGMMRSYWSSIAVKKACLVALARFVDEAERGVQESRGI